MLIWGLKSSVTRLAVLFAVCGFCRHEGAQTIEEWRRKFTLFFIPLFTTSTKYVQQCTMCAAQTQVSKEYAESASGPPGGASRGQDALVQLAVGPEELRGGSVRQIQVETGVRCPSCGGRGDAGPAPCTTCAGNGRIRATRTVSARIPAASSYGIRVRLEGEGEVGPRGGPSGDIYVELVDPSRSPAR